MPSLLETLRRAITEQDLLVPGDRVLVAVSGGPDSLALLHALLFFRNELGLADLQAAHLDHGLRGDESAGEAQFVADRCRALGVPCTVGRADVAARKIETRQGTQEAARDARYAFLEETARQTGANKIVTGHTQDDQTETILLNILRGAGLDGLRGIPSQRGPFIRPLLDTSRAAVEAYCVEQGLMPRWDLSNADTSHYTRNKVRLELVPLLARDYNPSVGAALRRLSQVAARDADYMRAQAESALSEAIVDADPRQIVLNTALLRSLHPALRRHVLRAALARLRGTLAGVTHAHLEQLCAAPAWETGPAFAVTLPAPPCTVRVGPQTVTLTLPEAPAARVTPVALPVPGEAWLPEIGWTIRATTTEQDGPGETATLDADCVRNAGLCVRVWQPGDRIAPLGLGGHTRKVQDIFTDAKVPRQQRRAIPLVVDESGILWIVGHAIADRAKVTEATRQIIYLTGQRQS